MLDTSINHPTILDLEFERQHLIWESEHKENFNRAELHALIQKGDPESLCKAWHINQCFGYYSIERLFALKKNKVVKKLYDFFVEHKAPKLIHFRFGNVLPIYLGAIHWEYSLFINFHNGYLDIQNDLYLIYPNTMFPIIFWKMNSYMKLFLNPENISFVNFELHYNILGAFDFVENLKKITSQKVFVMVNENTALSIVPPQKDNFYDLPF